MGLSVHYREASHFNICHHRVCWVLSIEQSIHVNQQEFVNGHVWGFVASSAQDCIDLQEAEFDYVRPAIV